MARILKNHFKNINNLTRANIVVVKARRASEAVDLFTKRYTENDFGVASFMADPKNIFKQMLETEDYYAGGGESMLTSYKCDKYFFFCGNSANFLTYMGESCFEEYPIVWDNIIDEYQSFVRMGARDKDGKLLEQSELAQYGYKDRDLSVLLGGCLIFNKKGEEVNK